MAARANHVALGYLCIDRGRLQAARRRQIDCLDLARAMIEVHANGRKGLAAVGAWLGLGCFDDRCVGVVSRIAERCAFPLLNASLATLAAWRAEQSGAAGPLAKAGQRNDALTFLALPKPVLQLRFCYFHRIIDIINAVRFVFAKRLKQSYFRYLRNSETCLRQSQQGLSR